MLTHGPLRQFGSRRPVDGTRDRPLIPSVRGIRRLRGPRRNATAPSVPRLRGRRHVWRAWLRTERVSILLSFVTMPAASRRIVAATRLDPARFPRTKRSRDRQTLWFALRPGADPPGHAREFRPQARRPSAGDGRRHLRYIPSVTGSSLASPSFIDLGVPLPLLGQDRWTCARKLAFEAHLRPPFRQLV